MIRKLFSWKIMLCWVSILILANCKIPYDPPLKSTASNFLVVEGFIDGSATTTIKLSRSRMLSAGDTAALKYELNAHISIEDDHQDVYSLNEVGNGIYTNANISNLNPAFQYRLHIITSNGKDYLSDFVPFKPSPLIDTIGWKLKDNGVQVFVNTHDPNEATKYYRWEYNETWEFHSNYDSYLKYDKATNTVIPRTDQVHICWQSKNSTSVILGSSAKLSHDIINEGPLVYIEQHDQKLSVLYSIWVKQYALDVNAYNYWTAMKSNTESIGSIFDPQPNETIGNIHCTTDAAEMVIGYISAGNSIEKRVFISNSSMPTDWNIPPQCEQITVPDIPDSLRNFFGGGYSPITDTRTPTGSLAYIASTVECVDCTISGTNVKPFFWP